MGWTLVGSALVVEATPVVEAALVDWAPVGSAEATPVGQGCLAALLVVVAASVVEAAPVC